LPEKYEIISEIWESVIYPGFSGVFVGQHQAFSFGCRPEEQKKKKRTVFNLCPNFCFSVCGLLGHGARFEDEAERKARNVQAFHNDPRIRDGIW
jgi:hypothetical protein